MIVRFRCLNSALVCSLSSVSDTTTTRGCRLLYTLGWVQSMSFLRGGEWPLYICVAHWNSSSLIRPSFNSCETVRVLRHDGPVVTEACCMGLRQLGIVTTRDFRQTGFVCHVHCAAPINCMLRAVLFCTIFATLRRVWTHTSRSWVVIIFTTRNCARIGCIKVCNIKAWHKSMRHDIFRVVATF